MRRLVPILVLVTLAALAAVALARVGSAPAARATAVAATGSFEVTNSDGGGPIFAATNIGPGGSADGTVTIEDTGSTAATLTLHRGKLLDTPGLGGGTLSDRLLLAVVDITAPAVPHTVYAGPLATMPDQPAGKLEPGEARTFEFTATLPEGGEPSLENALQGASTTVSYAWVAEEADEDGGDETPGGGEEGSGGSGSGGGGSPGDSAGNGGAGAVAGQRAVLNLTVPKVRRALRSGGLIVWTRCDEACRLTVRGRLRASAGWHHRGARIRFAQKRPAVAGPQRLRIPIPPELRRWLHRRPAPKTLRARLRFIAVGTDGQRDAVLKKVRLRAGGR
jgi:hypothetical protein